MGCEVVGVFAGNVGCFAGSAIRFGSFGWNVFPQTLFCRWVVWHSRQYLRCRVVVTSAAFVQTGAVLFFGTDMP